MSTLFDDLEESLLHTHNSSPRESLEDMGLDDEERDKIVNSISGTGLSDLNVDYSSFANHIFFGSAYAASNFALERVVKDYPLDGELKDKNAWRETNTGYENWFYDNYPKQQGYAIFSSGTTGFVAVDDFERKINLNSGSSLSSFTIEAVITSPMQDGTIQPIVSFSHPTDANQFLLFSVRGVDGTKPKLLNLYYVSGGVDFEMTASLSDYADESLHVAAVYNRDNAHCYLYIDGELAGKRDVSTRTGSFETAPRINIGYFNYQSVATEFFFSGAMDDVRIWTSVRDPELIKRNAYRTTHANHSGGLKLYYKFNEPEEYAGKIIDYSGNGLHGFLSGANTSYSANIRSGTLGGWFKDDGDPILALANTRTNDFITNQRNSGSLYDDDNANMIFNLVPGFFVEGEDVEYQQLFLLLTARHFDRLKLYIQHLSNVTKATTTEFNGPPENLLDLTAKHYGLDIGGIYAGSDARQYFYGEDVRSSGSLENSISSIRAMLKRNVVANLAHILKGKSTQEAIKNTLHALGLDENIVNISEYTDFSGGIKTTYTPKTVERRVAKFTDASNIYVSGANLSLSDDYFQGIYGMAWQVRALFSTGSQHLSQSLFRIKSDDAGEWGQVWAERTNLTASTGKFVASMGNVVFSSSVQEIWNNNWVNFNLQYNIDSQIAGYYISSIDRTGLIFSASETGFSVPVGDLSVISPIYTYLGTSGSLPFDGHMQEFRFWSGESNFNDWLPRFERQSYDWEQTEVSDPIAGYKRLKAHLKLNDHVGSSDGTGPIHNYANGLTGSYYTGFSSSADFNFPGKYIDKLETAYNYDLNVDNDKIRIREGSEFSDEDVNLDIPFVSIDFSPVTSLNKEIMKWMGNLERFGQIVSDPLYAHRDTNAPLDAMRSAFFRERVQSRIDYAAFANLIKWFDNNFAYLLRQLVPLDVAHSISNYVIEPHILEYNKVKKFIGAGAAGRTANLEASVSLVPSLTASSIGHDLDLADPGRYGAFVSASAAVTDDIYLLYSSSSNGVNHSNFVGRRIMDEILRDNLDRNAPEGYGNGFYVTTITGSNYLKNTLNVNPHFAISGVYYLGGGAKGSQFLSSSHGEPTSTFSSSFNGYQDARWLWMVTGMDEAGAETEVIDENVQQYVIHYGLGYGGMFGQFRMRNNQSIKGKPIYPDGSTEVGSRKGSIGENSVIGKAANVSYIELFNSDNLRTFILWPKLNAYDGVELFLNLTDPIKFSDGQPAANFGEPINIEGYNTLNIEILGRTNRIVGPANATQINFEVKFQFFSLETPGTYGFETVMSASRVGTSYANNAVEVKYNLTTEQLPKGKVLNFALNLERSLPKQRFMRVYITPQSVEGESIGSFFILCKAVLSNNERTVDDLSIRSM